jgi:hypothetical protein
MNCYTRLGRSTVKIMAVKWKEVEVESTKQIPYAYLDLSRTKRTHPAWQMTRRGDPRTYGALTSEDEGRTWLRHPRRKRRCRPVVRWAGRVVGVAPPDLVGGLALTPLQPRGNLRRRKCLGRVPPPDELRPPPPCTPSTARDARVCSSTRRML